MAILCEKHDLEIKYGKSPSKLNLILRMLNQLPHLYLTDKFSIESFEHIIAGGDIVLNLISAIQLCKDGDRVLIYRSEPDDLPGELKELFEMRYNFSNKDIIKYIEAKLDIKCNGDDIDSLICALCDECARLNDESSGTIMIIDNFSIYSDKCSSSRDGNDKLFWIDTEAKNTERADWKNAFTTLKRLKITLPYIKKGRKRNTKPILIIKTGNVIVTTMTHQRFMDDDGYTYIGNAEKGIVEFDKFNARHRLLDVISALSIKELIKNKDLKKKLITTLEII